MFGYSGFDSKNRDPFKGVFERAVDGGLRVTIRVRGFRRILKKGAVASGLQQLYKGHSEGLFEGFEAAD